MKVNQSHFTKSTQVAYGWDGLRANVARGLAMAADGRAFDAEREARQIERNGTAADQQLIWDTWRQDEAGTLPAPAVCIAQAEALERAAERWERFQPHRPDMPPMYRTAAAERRAAAARESTPC